MTFFGGSLTGVTGGTGGSIDVGTSYQWSAINSTINNMDTSYAGLMWISDSDLGGVTPNYNDTGDTRRYNYVELAGNSTSSNSDVSIINWYSIPLAISTTTTATHMTKGFAQPGQLAGFSQRLADLSGNSTAAVVKNGSNEIVRVISPNAAGSVISNYNSFNSYINSVFTGPSTPGNINIDNSYAGAAQPGGVPGPTQGWVAQDYQTSSITYNGSTLTITGSSDQFSSFTMTSTVDLSQFSEAIYLSVFTYDLDYTLEGGGSSSDMNKNTGDNDVFSAVSRDLAAGFQFGFIDSAEYGSLTSAEWQTMTSEFFSEIQSAGNYNEWADEAYQTVPGTYGFPFSDYLSPTGDAAELNPLLTTDDGDTLTVTLQSVSAVPEPTIALQMALGLGLLALRRRSQS